MAAKFHSHSAPVNGGVRFAKSLGGSDKPLQTR